jgi:hypothetical protein
MIFAKERERETFGFVYWLPGDVWKRETETFGFAYWLPDDIWKRERVSIQNESLSLSLSLFQILSGNQNEKPKVSLSFFLKHHLVTSMQNRKSLFDLWKRERETFGSVYWLPVDLWKRERETSGFAYWLPGHVWKKREREAFGLFQTSPGNLYAKPKVSLSLFQTSPGNQYTKPKVSLSLFFKHHLVTSIQNESLSLSLPDDIWKRERDFWFCILVTRWYLR